MGRLVGATAEEMRLLLNRGDLGPEDWQNQLVMAQAVGDADISDIVPVHQIMQNWGYDIRNDDEHPNTTDSTDWDASDLQSIMRDGYGAMYYAGHGSAHGISDNDKHDVAIDDSMVSAQVKPVVVLLACGTGYTYDELEGDPALAYRTIPRKLVHYGASAVVAPAGVAYYWPIEGTSYYGEELTQRLWQEMIGYGYSVSVGNALKSAKLAYDPGVLWWDEDEKTVMEYTLVGAPWVRLPELAGISGEPKQSLRSLADPDSAAPYGTPRLLDAQTFVISSTLPIDSYRVITEGLEGFNLLQVDGFKPYMQIGAPMSPVAKLPVSLPAGAEVVTVTAAVSDPVVIGDLNIPTARHPEGGDPGSGALEIVEVPDDYGIFPTQFVYYVTRTQESVNTVYVYAFPAVCDPAADQATLYQHMTVRVEYRLAEEVGLSRFHLEKPLYDVGETLNAWYQAFNAGDQPVIIRPTISFWGSGTEAALQVAGAPLIVPAGAVRTAEITCTLPITPDRYIVSLSLSKGGQVVAKATDQMLLVPGRILTLIGPETVQAGQVAGFAAALVQHSGSPVEANLTLSIVDAQGDLVTEVGPHTVTLSSGIITPAVFTCTLPSEAIGGNFKAALHGDVEGQRVLPEVYRFQVKAQARVSLPLLLKQR